MCLYLSKNARPKKALWNKKCYKILLRYNNKYYKTPFTETRVFNEVLSGIKPFKASGSEISNHIKEFYNTIDEGVIHVYKNKKDALRDCGANEDVFLCVIPKGTEYIKGKDSPHRYCTIKQYGAKEIKFIKKITNNSDI